MNRIGIIVAMSAEYRLVEALLEEKREEESNGFRFLFGRVAGKEVVLMQSGIGKVCAAVGVSEMIRNFHPDGIVNTGVAGGIDASLRVMDIVVGELMVYHDVWCGEGNETGQVQGFPAFFQADPGMLEKTDSIRTEVNLVKGLICTGDKFITDRQALDAIKKDFPAGLAVDMESCAMAQVCYLYQVPFLSFRIISDTPGQVDDHARQYKDFWTVAPEKSFQVLKNLVEHL